MEYFKADSYLQKVFYTIRTIQTPNNLYLKTSNIQVDIQINGYHQVHQLRTVAHNNLN